MSTAASRDNAVRRLASANGHLAAVLDMARHGADCSDIVFQLRAVRGAIHQAEQALLEEHIRRCIGHGTHLDPGIVDEILTLGHHTTPNTARTRSRPGQELRAGARSATGRNP